MSPGRLHRVSVRLTQLHAEGEVSASVRGSAARRECQADSCTTEGEGVRAQGQPHGSAGGVCGAGGQLLPRSDSGCVGECLDSCTARRRRLLGGASVGERERNRREVPSKGRKSKTA